MPTVHEQLSEQFHRWELRGRGWQVFPEPINPEPPFRPFYGHYLPDAPVVDDGRKPTFLSSFVEKLSRKLSTVPPELPAQPTKEEEPEPEPLCRDPLVELQTSLPAKLDISKETFEQFLLNLSLCREPIAFELIGVPDRVTAQFAAHPDDAPLVRRQLQAYFPEAVFQQRESALPNAWRDLPGPEEFAVEFGLEREFMFPLASGKIDPFIGIIGALSELQTGELGLFQVLFQPAHNRWAESITNSVTGADGRPFFVDAPELADAAKAKVARPLFAAVLRIAIKAERHERILQLARDLSGSLRVFAHPQGNALIPLHNDEYPSFEDHIEDVLSRQTRRSGMLLNSEELIGFVHLPGSAVRSPVLERQAGKSKAAPAIVRITEGLLIGTNDHAGQSVPVWLSPEQRVRHTHIIGSSGTGKSTLLFNLITQDIENGEGLGVLDPHGDLIDRILGVIPPERVADVVLVDPSDEQYSVGFNILSAHSELEKNLLSSDLVSVFQRLSTSWGDQMNSVLQNAILAFLESPRPGTIADLRRFLIEPAFRNEFLTSVQDSEVLYYWQKSFPHLSGNKSIGSILTRLDTFLAQKPIRHMVSQPENRLDFAQIMDSGKIFLAKLPEGLLGRENSYLLGTLLVSKFQQIAMSRQAQQIAARRDFWLYIDEFANFITPSMAEILSGARKYRIGLTLAHHELHQLQRSPEVASAVMSHPFTRIVFRVGDDDAKKLSEGFSSFEARDLRNLEAGHAVCRVERSDYDFNLRIPLPQEPDQGQAGLRRQEVITASREKYARPRADIEAALRAKLETPTAEPEQPKARPVVPSVSKDVETKPVPKSALVPKPASPAQTEIAAAPPIAPQPVAPVIPEIAPPAPKKPEQAFEPEPPPDLGRGGNQHQAIQKRIKEAAESLGFRSTIEKEVLDGKGSVDLLLERAGQIIACEIAITTTIDHEVGNVAKCLKAGFPKIAVIAVDEDRLRKIASAVSGSLGERAADRVEYCLPETFIEKLRTMPVPAPPQTSKMSHGYKVKRHAPALTPDERKQQEETAIRIIAEAMRRPKEKD
jgi:hypothetical protein